MITPLVPAKAGTQGNRFKTLSMRPWTPAFAGVSGMRDCLNPP
jgi:hypothetical protein